ncbi:ABC transporter ATP-binding protein [Halomonas kalidii]|uniref:ABC transporter ATP-binding protein n=1 Tax=Halomonas kalidii TaxID=3043293 RepID=A0ABT6VJJ1_9GAMM|nr:ABC transporter ATP-binding protein [Halomonas kalidii]MDI5934148.1 ABC transporter ATP-binding protein [Halomonas kalidii]
MLRLQILIVFMSLSQIASVFAIGPFMSLVGDMSRLQGQGILSDVYHASGIGSPFDFLFWLGIVVLAFLMAATVISMYTTWRMCRYGAQIGVDISSRLFRFYMKQPWLFHVGGSSSTLTKHIAQECQRVSVGVIKPVIEVNAKLMMSTMMAISLVIYSPMVALVGVLFFSGAYIFLYFTVRRSLIANGRLISSIQAMRFKIMSEGFGGIKDALVLGRQGSFIARFKRTSDAYAYASGTTQLLSQVPRYAMELIAFGSIIFLVLYLLSAHQGDLGQMLPILSVYALAGFKVLPAFQQIYQGISSVRSNLAAFEVIQNDLKASCTSSEHDNVSQIVSSNDDTERGDSLELSSGIKLLNVVFHYPGKGVPALNGLSIDIPANKVVGLVGASGSGKSTAVDVLLGLIQPDSGQVLVDGKPLSAIQKSIWKHSVGYVSQSIFLADSSIAENIAFGITPEHIDEARVMRAANLSHLDELLESLPEGLGTTVGERGIQLSGGQRQRIGIARALYFDASILIMDEATSALDGITETLVMDAIQDFSGSKTIIMIAHRLTTVRQCDCIYLMSHGRVMDQGRYDELASRNEMFKRMAKHV